MPSKAYIQLLQRSFLHFKRNSSRNVPSGVSHVALIDDDDLTRWFVQLLYHDENKADFFVSIELVFNETDNGASDAHDGIGGPPLSRSPGPSAAAAQLAAATAARRDERNTTTAAPQPTTLHPRRHDASASAAGTPVVLSSSSHDGGSGEAGGGARDRDAPAATSPQPSHKPISRLVTRGEARLVPSTAEGRPAPTQHGDAASPTLLGTGTTSIPPSAAPSHRGATARMPLVFVVAPRLIASFIHHGALCSLELMSQHWELSPENVALLLIALHETLNPFAGDGRVSVDEAERVESRREAAAAAGGLGGVRLGGGGELTSASAASSFAGAYSQEEHQLGIDYIRRAHPHLFRRYVEPTVAASADAAADAAAATAGAGGGAGTSRESLGLSQREQQLLKVHKGSNGSTPAVFISESISPSASMDVSTATAAPLSANTTNDNDSGRGREAGRRLRVQPGSAAPYVVRDVSHLNTAVYDALVSAYGTAVSRSACDARPLPQAAPACAPAFSPAPAGAPGASPSSSSAAAAATATATAAAEAPVVMLLDSPALMADAKGLPPLLCGVRGVQQQHDDSLSESTGDGGGGGGPTDGAAAAMARDTISVRGALGASGRHSPRPPSTTEPATCTPLFAPVLQAERVLRARPPAVSHLVYTPANLRPAVSQATDRPPAHAATHQRPYRQVPQRVAELWIPLALPTPPPAAAPSSAVPDVLGGATEVVRLVDGHPPLSEAAATSASWSMDVHLVGDCADAEVHRASVACVLRNVRVSASRSSVSSKMGSTTSAVSSSSPSCSASSPLRFSLQTCTAPSPAGDVHTCDVPRGLTLRCSNMFIYGHLRILGHFVLHNCVFIGSLMTEELGSLQVSHSDLALMPDDRLLLRLPPPALQQHSPSHAQLHACRGASPHTASTAAAATAAAATTSAKGSGKSRGNSAKALSPSPRAAAAAAAAPLPPPPPALFYATRKECVLVLDSSRVELSDNTHVYRLMPDVQPVPQRSQRQLQRRSASDGEEGHHRDGRGVKHGDYHDDDEQLGEDELEGGYADVEAGGLDVSTAPVPSPLAATMTVLRSLLLVSNQGRLRLVRCTVHPGRNTERTIFAEQDAIVDMAYCHVTAAISSAVSVQGCRAYLEHCSFHGSLTTTTAATSAVLTAEQEAAAAAAGVRCAGEEGEGVAACSPPPPPPPIRVDDTTRCTGLNVELGGTLTARHCEARHLYFAFCVIAHSVAHFYRCHAADVVNGFTVDASAATLDACSAHTNHVGAFVLRKAKCILTDDNCGSFQRRCTLLGEAHEAARHTVTAELHDAQSRCQQQQRQQRQQPARSHSVPESSPCTPAVAAAAAAAMAARTTRVAQLARRLYVEELAKADTLSAAVDAAPTSFASPPTPPSPPQAHRPSREQQQQQQQQEEEESTPSSDSVIPPLGFFGGRFSLEVRDAALKATGITLMNAHDTSVYAYEDSVVELEECVLWSTVEAEEAANAAAAAAVDAEGSSGSLHTRPNNTSNNSPGAALSSRRPASPRQRSCGVKVVQAALTARRCFMTGYSFGVAAIQSAQAQLQECLVVNAINGYTVDHSRCRLRHCGADTSHVGLFALNDSLVEAEGTPHVVGVGARRRTPPLLLCGGVPAVWKGDVYGVESQASTMRCTGITVLRGRDSGFNAYSGSVLQLSKCLVDMSPVDAASYVFHRPHPTTAANGSPGTSSSATSDDTAPWTRQLHLDVCGEERELSSPSTSGVHGGEVGDADAQQLPMSPSAVSSPSAAAAGAVDELPPPPQPEDQQHQQRRWSASRGEMDGSSRTSPRAGNASPALTTPTPPSAPSSSGRVAPAMRSTGVKVWSGSQCHAQDTEVQCVTFGFASLGPETLLDAQHCVAKHVVNGFTSDGGALELTKCSASSNHVGVYVLSHAHCVVRRGSYTAKKYGIECRSGVLSLQGHVKIHGFSRIGLYLYDGAHCEADPDCVLDIHALKHASPWTAASQASASSGGGGAFVDGTPSSALPSTFPSPPPPSGGSAACAVCGPEEAANVSDLLPACIALDEATAHLPQAILGGGARCGITCGDGATGYVGKCFVYDCALVGVNVFHGAHLTLANALIQCARQYAVVVHAGGVCRIVRGADGEADVDAMDDGAGNGNGGAALAGLSAFAVGALVSRGVKGATQAALLLLRRAWAGAAHVAGVPCRAVAGRLPWWWWLGGPRVRAGAVQSGLEKGCTSSSGTTTRRPRCTAAATTTAVVTPAAGGDRLARSSSAAAQHTQRLGGMVEAAAAVLTAGSGIHGRAQENEQQEVGGARTLPLTGAARRRLRWLRWQPHRHTRLPFHLNTLMAPPGATTAAAAGKAGDAPQRVVVPPAAAATTTAAATASSPVPPAFPCVCPAISGGCVVRGTCTMERIVLRPTNVMARLLAAQSRGTHNRAGASDGHSRDSPVGSGREEEGGAMGEDAVRSADGSAATAPGMASSSAVTDDTGAGDNNTCSTAVVRPELSAEDGCAAAAAAAAVSLTAQVVQRLLLQPPAVHVCQHGVLSLTDCLIDVSLSTADASLSSGRRGTTTTTAVVACEGPYAKLHCDHVRIARGEAVSDTDSDVDGGSSDDEEGSREGRAAGACGVTSALASVAGTAPLELSGAPRSGISSADAVAPSHRRSSSASICSSGSFSGLSASDLASAERRGSRRRRRSGSAAATRPAVAAAVDVATVPLLLVSLVGGAQCVLHMVATSLHDWPYAGVTESPSDAGAARTQPSQRHAGVLSSHRYAAARNTGVMLRTACDAIAEATYAHLSAVLATDGAVVRLAHCTVAGLLPVQLSSGSSVSLTFCRVVGGLRAGPAAPAMCVHGDADLTLLRTSVWTLSRGAAVWRAAGGAATVRAIESDEVSLGAGTEEGQACECV